MKSSAPTRLKIGIVDCSFFSLQRRLLQEGHTLVVYAEGMGPVPEMNVCNVEGTVIQACSLMELAQHNCDLYITDDDADAFDFLAGYAKLHKKAINIFGFPRAITQLESDRELANLFMANVVSFIPTKGSKKSKLKVSVPKLRVCVTPDAAVDYLTRLKTPVVIKQHSNSPQEVMVNRTLVLRTEADRKAAVAMIRSNQNPWFNQTGYGGAVFEPMISGREVCFGIVCRTDNPSLSFDPVLPYYDYFYVCEEHKGANNENRGGLMTGEVGTSMVIGPRNAFSGTALEYMEHLSESVSSCADHNPYVHFACCLDANHIIDAKGALTFLEFTTRFGRPTLETMLTAIPGNFGAYLLRLIHPEGLIVGKRGPSAYEIPLRMVHGVTAYPHGSPLVRSDSPLLSAGYTLPTEKGVAAGIDYGVHPLFSLYDTTAGTYFTGAPVDRLFTVVAADTLPQLNQYLIPITNASKKVRAALYHNFSSYNQIGVTWRDDVGANFGSLMLDLMERGIVSDATECS